ncbi:putative baseplate assembly protein [Baekduia soli]|uniref:putative baseplate assembly protein n=1 Tax=Baekduia soli TaxID=496014 RepID=UPI001652A3FE|nr:putative baseplate assembly protein [Baekduia soli]
MALSQIVLDDRRFQDLVNEARLRIHRSCPEWTEHNVSDPGITLIELFAWMTEMLVYRVNRVPDKLHVALLDLLGLGLAPPSAATADLRFRLAGTPTEPVTIPAGDTEVGTLRTASDESIIFQTTESITIAPLAPTAYVVEHGGTARNVKVAGGVARPTGPDQAAFGKPPAVGDALYVGFEDPLARLTVRIDVECSPARGAGVDPEDPPLRWEVSGPDGDWLEAEVLEDTTGGFNYGSGAVELQLPSRSAARSFAGQRCHWVRCRVHDHTRSGARATIFNLPPEVYEVTAGVVGAMLPAAHSARERGEVLGESDGTPGQCFTVRHAPVLPLAPDERLELRAPGAETWQPWEPRDSFVESGEHDRHFHLDLVSGEVAFGPSIREADGRWTQYGAVPEKGATVRFSTYRRGGGRVGNVAAGALTVLRSPIPGVATVRNPAPARGGVDAETLDSARHRAAMEIRSRHRAVTAEDFEYLCLEASPRVGRVVCVPPREGHAIGVHIVPRVDPADRRLAHDELLPDEDLLTEVAGYLDAHRLVGTTVHLLPATFRGVSVVANLQASILADPQRVEQDVIHALYTYLNPIVGGSPTGPGPGWGFGRTLSAGELHGIVHAVDGVQQVKILRIYETDVRTGEQSAKPAGNQILLGPTELIASGTHIIKATHDEAT